MTRIAKLGHRLRYHPADDERDPTGAPMTAESYPAVVTIARTDDQVQVTVTIDGDNEHGIGVRVARLVPLIAPGEEPPAAAGGCCTWF